MNNDSRREVKAVNNGQDESLHPAENLVNNNEQNLAEAESRVDERPLRTENTPDDYLEDDLEDDDEEIDEDDYGDGDEEE